MSLFSGYEGFGLGLRLAGLPIRTIGSVEIDDYCQRLIQVRSRDGLLDWAPIIRDVRRADFGRLAGLVDLVTAGYLTELPGDCAPANHRDDGAQCEKPIEEFSHSLAT